MARVKKYQKGGRMSAEDMLDRARPELGAQKYRDIDTAARAKASTAKTKDIKGRR